MKKVSTYKAALKQWGVFSQFNVLVEECAELIFALQKFQFRNGSEHNVIEELADVEIMCEQMRLVFSPARINKVKKQKLEQLQERLREL